MIVAGKISGVVLLQGEEAVQAVAAFVQDKCGQQAGGSAVAVVVGVNGDKLVVDQAGYEGSRQPGPFRLVCPGHQGGHEGGDIFCLRGQVDQSACGAVLDGILALPVGRGLRTGADLDQCMKPLDQLLGERLFLRCPILDPEESVPVIAHLGDIPFPASDLQIGVGDCRFCLGHGEAVAFNESGVVHRPHASMRPKLLLGGGRQGRMLH